MAGRLIIASKRYSSWSLRGWLAVRLAGLDVEEIVVRLDGSGASPAVRAASPSGKVPYLFHDGAEIWESTAIVEYCAEIAPSLWPADRVARARARSVAAEMHAGFRDLRSVMPMNIGYAAPGHGRGPGVLADIARIEALWGEMLGDGPFLSGGSFGAVDAMFAPVVARFRSYEPALSAVSQAYCDAVWGFGLMQEWVSAALAEGADWHVAKYDVQPEGRA